MPPKKAAPVTKKGCILLRNGNQAPHININKLNIIQVLYGNKNPSYDCKVQFSNGTPYMTKST